MSLTQLKQENQINLVSAPVEVGSNDCDAAVENRTHGTSMSYETREWHLSRGVMEKSAVLETSSANLSGYAHSKEKSSHVD